MADNEEFKNVTIDPKMVALTRIEHGKDDGTIVEIPEGSQVTKFQKLLGDLQTKALIAGGSIGFNTSVRVPDDYEKVVADNADKDEEIARLKAELAKATTSSGKPG